MNHPQTPNSDYCKERRESFEDWFFAREEKAEPKPSDTWQWLTDAKWIGAFLFFAILLVSIVAYYVFEKKPCSI